MPTYAFKASKTKKMALAPQTWGRDHSAHSTADSSRLVPETNMRNMNLIAIGMAVALLMACGGGDGSPGAPTQVVPPAAPQAITCPSSAALLTKSTLSVGGVTREYYDSAPSNYAALRENDARGITVLVNFHDAGETGQSGAASTCWNEVGDAAGIVTVFPSAVSGTWNTASATTAADEVGFINALLPVIKTKYSLASNAIVYYTGVGQGARMAQAMAMQAPLYLGAVAGVGGTADAAVFNLPAAQLPPTTMAAWIINRSAAEAFDPSEAQQVDYWNNQNAVYTPAVSQSDSSFTSLVYASQDRPYQSVKVSTMLLAGYAGKALSQEIWDGMFSQTVRFFDDDRTNGTLHQNQSIADMGLTDTTKEFIAGSPRRWLTYLPSNYAALVAAGKKLPLVLSLHGRNGSARWQAVTSQWHLVGEQNGFIVVYPQGTGATWSSSLAPDSPDVLFMLSLIGELEADYAIDPTRIYMNGASMGSFMTNRMAVQYPLLFAAIAPCYSGHLSPAGYTSPIVRTDVPMPTWQCRGADEVPSDFPGGAAGEAAAQVFWRETVNKNSGIPTLQLDGRKVTQIWNNGVGEYRWQVTEYQPHFWHEGEAQKIWAEMFSKYGRAANGQLVQLP
jgi:poly(3-hydroxybutyrate) depolymerase